MRRMMKMLEYYQKFMILSMCRVVLEEISLNIFIPLEIIESICSGSS